MATKKVTTTKKKTTTKASGQPYADQVRADLAKALRDPDASALRLKVLICSLLETLDAPNGLPTTTHRLHYSPANERQMNKVWSRCVVDLIHDMRDAAEPFDVFIQVRPIQSRKQSRKAKGGAR